MKERTVLVGVSTIFFLPAIAAAQLQFSSWPVCGNGPFAVAGWRWDDGNQVQGFLTTQPVPAKQSDWKLATVAVAAAFWDSNNQDIPLSSLTTAHIMAWLGPKPMSGQPAGTPFFVISVALSQSMFADTGFSPIPDLKIWRVSIPIPVQTIPAGNELQLGVSFDLDPAVGGAGIFESSLVNPALPHGWVYDFPTGINFSDGNGGGCGDMVAIELYGPAPIPTVPEWGMVAMTLLMLTAGTLVWRSGMTKPVAA